MVRPEGGREDKGGRGREVLRQCLHLLHQFPKQLHLTLTPPSGHLLAHLPPLPPSLPLPRPRPVLLFLTLLPFLPPPLPPLPPKHTTGQPPPPRCQAKLLPMPPLPRPLITPIKRQEFIALFRHKMHGTDD
jgi:hypothetical protein